MNGDCLVSRYFWKDCLRLLNHAYWPASMLWTQKKRKKNAKARVERIDLENSMQTDSNELDDSGRIKNYLEEVERFGEKNPEFWPALLRQHKELWARMLLNETANALLSS